MSRSIEGQVDRVRQPATGDREASIRRLDEVRRKIGHLGGPSSTADLRRDRDRDEDVGLDKQWEKQMQVPAEAGTYSSAVRALEDGSPAANEHGIIKAYDPCSSPVGWYIGSYVLRFVELADAANDDPERRFLVWENTVLVKAPNIDQAFDKIVTLAREETKPYKAGAPPGIDAQWLFDGVTELLPIYDEIGDGCEVMWAKYQKKLKNIGKRVRTKAEFNRPPRGFKG